MLWQGRTSKTWAASLTPGGQMNQESTRSGHQNKVFCFEQRVVQIDQGYLGQQCP